MNPIYGSLVVDLATTAPYIGRPYPRLTTLMPELRIQIPKGLDDKINAAKPDFLDRKGFVCLLLSKAIDADATLGKPSAETAAKPEQEKVLPLKAVPTEQPINKRSNKSVPPSLTAHEDLIRAFWKTKQGSKSDAGWKLLMTELQKIQDKYSDRVVRDQLELAAANRWKGVSLKNYEQFGLSAQKRATGSTFDWDSINGVSI